MLITIVKDDRAFGSSTVILNSLFHLKKHTKSEETKKLNLKNQVSFKNKYKYNNVELIK